MTDVEAVEFVPRGDNPHDIMSQTMLWLGSRLGDEAEVRVIVDDPFENVLVFGSHDRVKAIDAGNLVVQSIESKKPIPNADKLGERVIVMIKGEEGSELGDRRGFLNLRDKGIGPEFRLFEVKSSD